MVRNLFLSSQGLYQVTELIYLDSTRPWALKLFETLILNDVFSSSKPEANKSHRVSKSAEELASGWTGDATWCCNTFYEDFKKACPTQKDKISMSARKGRSLEEVHLNTIHRFLCLAFLCVTKEAYSVRDTDGTTGNESTASESFNIRLPFLSSDSVALPPMEQMKQAADLWSLCCRAFLANLVFQREFLNLGGLDGCSRLMFLVIEKLASKNKHNKTEKKAECKTNPTVSDSSVRSPGQTELDLNLISPIDMTGKTKDPKHMLEEEWPLQCIRLFEAFLSICLHSSNSVLQKHELQFTSQVYIL